MSDLNSCKLKGNIIEVHLIYFTEETQNLFHWQLVLPFYFFPCQLIFGSRM